MNENKTMEQNEVRTENTETKETKKGLKIFSNMKAKYAAMSKKQKTEMKILGTATVVVTGILIISSLANKHCNDRDQLIEDITTLAIPEDPETLSIEMVDDKEIKELVEQVVESSEDVTVVNI